MTPSLEAKLGSLVVHLQEHASPTGRVVDLDAAWRIAEDPEVNEWLATIDPVMLPVRRDVLDADEHKMAPDVPTTSAESVRRIHDEMHGGALGACPAAGCQAAAMMLG